MNSAVALDADILERLKSDLGNKTTVILLESLKGEITAAESTLETAYQNSDWARVEVTAHALKSAAATFGATDLHHICRIMETQAKEWQSAKGDALMRAEVFDTFLQTAGKTLPAIDRACVLMRE